jgi:glycine oxidase
MAEQPWDFIIVGQGLAGTTLAWHLLDAGLRVLLIDADEPVTSSKIAAGLITPITGRRLALAWRIDEVLPMARAFYRRIEARTGQSFFHDRQAVRLFADDAERQMFEQRQAHSAFAPYIVDPQPSPLVDAAQGCKLSGGFKMHSAQLDVPTYLSASRQVLTNEKLAINWQHDVILHADSIAVGHHKTRHLVSCEGFAASRNPYFTWVPLGGAKGEILSVRFDAPLPPVPLHRGIWLAPTVDASLFRVGSTYDHEALDQIPTESGRHEIESQLSGLVGMPYEITAHQAAVRPVMHEKRVRVGRHPLDPRLGYFNGLGSKGALNAPWFAKLLADHLMSGQPLPGQFDIRKFAIHAARN